MSVLPTPGELGLRNRALYHGSVALDLGLRTALATAASVTSLPNMLAPGATEDQRRLPFYGDLARLRDVDAVFPAPPPVVVRSVPGDTSRVPGGRVELLTFTSPFVAHHPEVREAYAAHENNATARAQYWRHGGEPRPTLCAIHGFGASTIGLNDAFFSLGDFFADGWDVVLFTLPFHGSRRSSRTPGNGLELFANGMAQFNEAMYQAVCDFRVVLDHLLALGAPRVGLTGLSMGGYVSGLMAAIDDRLDFVVPNAAVTWMPPLMRNWFPASTLAAVNRRLRGGDDAALDSALASHSPLTYPARVPKERLMIVAGLGDRLAPPEQSLALWEHWDRPALHWFPGSHMVHLRRGDYLDKIRDLMAERVS